MSTSFKHSLKCNFFKKIKVNFLINKLTEHLHGALMSFKSVYSLPAFQEIFFLMRAVCSPIRMKLAEQLIGLS